MIKEQKFRELMLRYQDLDEAGLGDTEEASLVFADAMRVAPEDFKRDIHRIGVELGVIPATPDGYTDDGEPLYFLDKTAIRLGISPNDVPEHLRKNSYQGPMHRTN